MEKQRISLLFALVQVFVISIILHFLFSFKNLYAESKIVPVPMYSTSPNEGSTYGLMMVFMSLQQGQTNAMIAPSISKNDTIGKTGTFRLFYNPTPTKSFSIIPSISTKHNRNIKVEYVNQDRKFGETTSEVSFKARKDIFYRFFGLGPLSKETDESGYTYVGVNTYYRAGINLLTGVNLGGRISYDRVLVGGDSPNGIASTRERFPSAPGLEGSSILSPGLSLRIDTRDKGKISEAGLFSEFNLDYSIGVNNTNAFRKAEWETIALLPLSSFLQSALRVYWSQIIPRGKGTVPFYYQSMLGGSNRLRGFQQDRFVDRKAWTVDFEQRITWLRTKTFGVLVRYEIAPFVAIGQVYDSKSDMFLYKKVSTGLGIRAHVQPNMVARLDAATGGEGLKIYIDLGYPF